jgi:hypothetical protein
MTVWLGFVLFWIIGASVVVFGEGRGPWFLPFAGLGMFALGLLFVSGSKWLSRGDVQWLSTHIEKALEST